MRRRRPVLALVLASAAVLALFWATSSGCRRKSSPRRGPAVLPTVRPYKPRPLPTVIWATPVPGQPTRRPTLPG